jgi:hypothetical protein
MKTCNKTIEAVSPLATQEQSWIRRQDGKEFASADKFDGGTGFRPSPKSRPRSPSPVSRRYVENLFVVGASVYPFNERDNPIAF